MKKLLLIPILSGLVLSCTQTEAQELRSKEKIHKEYTVSNGGFMGLYNLNGSIKIEGYEGDKVIIDIDQTIEAKSKSELEEGKQEFKLGFDQKGDSLTLYTAEPYDTRPRSWNKKQNWNRNVEYQVFLNYVVKIPKGMNIRISTVNEGEISVTNVDGLIRANNVNGGITLKNIKGANDVHTVNGDVNINYTALPPNDAKYYTLNGDLRITYPANFTADCQFKTFNGEFFTDFDEVEKLPAETIKNKIEREGSTTYKLDKINRIRIGSTGGKNLKFETFNGNIYIKKG
jgi:hypothetical protein